MFDPPTSLSPSRVDAFTTCPMAFRFSSIERLPEPPGVHTTKGSLVHRALELLFTHPAPDRDVELARVTFDRAWAEYLTSPDLLDLALGDDELESFRDHAWRLTERYFQLEDPRQVNAIGLELRLEAELGELSIRGIIDRLDLEPDGSLVITDYKSGKAPPPHFRQQRLVGVHLYSLLCERVLGRRPRQVRLLYLGSGEVIEAEPTEQSVRFAATRTTAVFKAVAQACSTGDFRPRPGPLCDGCSFRAWCPAFGGDPTRARDEVAVSLRPVAVP